MRIIHSVSTQGGMRKSNKTNSLVLITSLESTYSDRWEEDVLHYTGEGLNGDQVLKRQNLTLAESNENGVNVFLYEKLRENAYRFHGRVKLSAHPYQELQNDESDKSRKVWMFPLKATEVAPSIPKSLVDSELIKEQKKLRKLAKDALAAAAMKDSKRARKSARVVTTIQQQRSPAISLCIKAFAEGVCDLCSVEAPFRDEYDQPYLECHHITWLAKGGEDVLENTVALCPNCHRKMHHLNNQEDITRLKVVANARRSEIEST